MFQKLFDVVDNFIENFKTINSVEELSKITFNILKIIKDIFCETLSNDMEQNEKLFNEIMGIEGLWKKIGEKAKKAMKKKEELLKFLLYISAIMNEFQNRLKEKQREEKHAKEFDKIIQKYQKLLKEILENKNLDEKTREKSILELKKAMEYELKGFSLER